MAENIIEMPDGHGMGTTHIRERIVRCRDCKRFKLDDSDHDHRGRWWCKRWGTDAVNPNGFCAWGCRKETDE